MAVRGWLCYSGGGGGERGVQARRSDAEGRAEVPQLVSNACVHHQSWRVESRSIPWHV